MLLHSSSALGSFGKVEVYKPFPVPAYKISKAALNMLTVQYAQEYENEGFVFVAVSPGVSVLLVPLICERKKTWIDR